MLQASTSDAIQGFLNVVVDPCLKDVGGLLQQLNKAEQSSSNTPTQATLGIGLCKVVPVLRGVVYLRERPLLALGVIGGFLGLFVGVGYRLGQRSKTK